MRLVNTFGGRPAYYDRNPTSQSMQYLNAAIGPHSSTSRATYTVPTGRKALMEFIDANSVRDGTATTAGLVLVQSGSVGGTQISSAQISTAIGSQALKSIGCSAMILAGATVQIFTQDGSTGGTNTYATGVKIVEFDA